MKENLSHKSKSSRDKGHGRLEYRKTEVYYLSIEQKNYLKSQGWNHIQSIIRVSRKRSQMNTRTKKYNRSEEQSFYISTTTLSAQEFNNAIRNHWGIENKNHYVRDVTMNEDASRIRNNPQIFSLLRSFALNILRHNNVKNIANELFKNTISFSNILSYHGIFNNQN
jgi:predicted transposase YbfD/YdcC